jgi:hypothetical protein
MAGTTARNFFHLKRLNKGLFLIASPSPGAGEGFWEELAHKCHSYHPDSFLAFVILPDSDHQGY